MCRCLSDIHLIVKLLCAKVSKTWGWLTKSDSGEGMILCFQCEDLSKILLMSKFETKWPNINLIITFCAIGQYQCLNGWLICSRNLAISLREFLHSCTRFFTSADVFVHMLIGAVTKKENMHTVVVLCADKKLGLLFKLRDANRILAQTNYFPFWFVL